MAKKIAIEGTSEHVKKSVAELLIRRLVAEWVVKGTMIRRLNVAPLPIRVQPCERTSPRIPEHLPPVETGGCTFKLASMTEEKKRRRRICNNYARCLSISAQKFSGVSTVLMRTEFLWSPEDARAGASPEKSTGN